MPAKPTKPKSAFSDPAAALPGEADILANVLADLSDHDAKLVYADWLEERDDPRGELLRKFVTAHRAGKPFLLHSCGNIEAIMPTLIEQAGIDAKHSFQDAVEPVEKFMDRWGQRVAALGGIDVHLLATGNEEAVVKRTRAVLEHTTGRGTYACGSGNSVTNYIPPGNYLAMVETVVQFNGRG